MGSVRALLEIDRWELSRNTDEDLSSEGLDDDEKNLLCNDILKSEWQIEGRLSLFI